VGRGLLLVVKRQLPKGWRCRFKRLPLSAGVLHLNTLFLRARRARERDGSMAQLHLVIGPVGAGKSTFALALSREHRAVRLTLDEWMAELYGADERPAVGRLEWYVERTTRCLEQMWKLATRMIDVGASVVLEIGLIQRDARAAFYERVDDAGIGLLVYVLDAPRDVRRARVMKRNAERGDTFSMHVPPEIFDLASDRWEPPDEAERNAREMRVVA
jgi:predicted kinase